MDGLAPLRCCQSCVRCSVFTGSIEQERTLPWFFPAALIGFVSIGTQGNGLCVLPIMTVMSALIGLGARRTVILAGLSLASFVLYFWGFNWGLMSPEEMSPPGPVTFTLFILTFLGSPFYYVVYYWLAGLQHMAGFVFGHGSLLVTNNYLDYPASRTAGIIVAMMTGGGLVMAATAITWRWLRSERTDTWQAPRSWPSSPSSLPRCFSRDWSIAIWLRLPGTGALYDRANACLAGIGNFAFGSTRYTESLANIDVVGLYWFRSLCCQTN